MQVSRPEVVGRRREPQANREGVTDQPYWSQVGVIGPSGITWEKKVQDAYTF